MAWKRVWIILCLMMQCAVFCGCDEREAYDNGPGTSAQPAAMLNSPATRLQKTNAPAEQCDPAENSPEPSAIDVITPAAHVPDTVDSPKIVIKKSVRMLELWDGDRLYGSYPIGLGWEPAGHKRAEGDGRTPEGTYYVCLRNGNSCFYLSLGISYPNKEDAQAALDAGTIDEGIYKKIADAINKRARPPWNTALGGEIMIHGGGAGSDWTAGCIAVDNDVMDILWKHCPNRTPIVIQP